jgi:hypothetical protein
MELRMKNDGAGEGQQQFTRQANKSIKTTGTGPVENFQKKIR